MHRRTWLKLGVASAALLAVGGGSIALLQPAWREGHLTEPARAVFHAAARAILVGSLPAAEPARATALRAAVDRIEGLVAGLPPHAQSELSQLLALLASAPGRRVFASLDVPWAEAKVERIQQSLQSMRTSSLALRQQAYSALHDLVSGAYFADPSTWAQLGYPGPRAI